MKGGIRILQTPSGREGTNEEAYHVKVVTHPVKRCTDKVKFDSSGRKAIFLKS